MSSDYSNISQFFSHPLVLLLIGALISGVFIPYFTNRAAKYQKGLEIKTDLVRRINESVTRFVISLDFLAVDLTATMRFERETMSNLGTDKKPSRNFGLYYLMNDLQDELKEIKKELGQDELKEGRKKILDQEQKGVSKLLEKLPEGIQRIEKLNVEAAEEYKQWRVSSTVIASQIKSYFPEFGEKKEGKLTWSSFEMTVGRAYQIVNDTYVNAMYSGPREIYWKEVVPNILREKDQIIVQIQNSSVSGLSEHLFSRFIKKFRPESNKPDEKINHESNQ